MKSGLALVVYGKTYQKYRAFERLKSAFQGVDWLLINNQKPVDSGEMEGHNRQFEFGAYKQALEQFVGYDRVLLLNDTAFNSHAFWLWLTLWQRAWNQKPVSGLKVWSDLRFDGITLLERPNPFAASWCMMALNQASVKMLGDTLISVLAQQPEPLSFAYEDFLSGWLSGRMSRGWHGDASAENIARKRQCIVWEHAWSRALLEAGIELHSFGSFDSFRLFLARFFDRLQNRCRAISRLINI